MSDLQIQSTDRPNGGRLITLTGPLTLNTLFDFQSMVRQLKCDLIIDLAGVPYMDSAGLGAILGAYASAQRNNHKFALVNVSERVLTLLNVAGVREMLPMFHSVDAAEGQKAKA
jgi:anti-sigma B factor antagonist